ncbi:relaxase/mobilization nuclease domain-containing protein [Rahnella aceris]|uniref:relaxase/mobilization nuclease domain-containing protein n=1 Tax=Rahnella sp. (strain Y9602) TaxID=2703885 RepID=UPI0036582944
MKSKIKRGKGFRGCLNYIFGVKEDKKDKPSPDFICSNMTGENIKELTQEFTQTRNIRSEVEKPVWHTSLSLTPEEKKLGPEKWQEIAENYLEKMGFDLANNQYVVVRHNDTEKDHIHIVANRVGLNGEIWGGEWEALKSIDVCQKLEKQHGLTQTKGLDRKTIADVKTPTQEEIEMGLRQNARPPRIVLQDTITEALADKPDTATFLSRLEVSGVAVNFNKASTGRISGVSFGYAGIHFKGSQLGKKFGWNKISEVINYEQDRDITHIRDINTTIDAARAEELESAGPTTEQPSPVVTRDVERNTGFENRDVRDNSERPSGNVRAGDSVSLDHNESLPGTGLNSRQKQDVYRKSEQNNSNSINRLKDRIRRLKKDFKRKSKIRWNTSDPKNSNRIAGINNGFGSGSVSRILDYAETAINNIRQQSGSDLHITEYEKIKALKLRLGIIKPTTKPTTGTGTTTGTATGAGAGGRTRRKDTEDIALKRQREMADRLHKALKKNAIDENQQVAVKNEKAKITPKQK